MSSVVSYYHTGQIIHCLSFRKEMLFNVIKSFILPIELYADAFSELWSFHFPFLWLQANCWKHYLSNNKVFFTHCIKIYRDWSKYVIYSQPVYNSYPWDPKKVAVAHRWFLCRGFSIKINIKISLAGLCLAVVDRLPLFRGSR